MKNLIKKIFRLFLKLLLVLLVVMVGMIVYHEYPRKSPETGPQKLHQDLTEVDDGVPSSFGETIMAGRLIHHQQSGIGLAGLEIKNQDDLLSARKAIEVEFPPGAALSFDLYIPPELLMNFKSAIQFEVVVKTDKAELETVFSYAYKQDWVGYAVNFFLARTQFDLQYVDPLGFREDWIGRVVRAFRKKIRFNNEFIDRFRHFYIDLSNFENQKGELIFRIEGPDLADEKKIEKITKWTHLPFHNGLNFISPRIWTSAARAENDFNIVFCFVDGLRADALSVYGYDLEHTPNIAKLAENGLLFERAYSPSNATRTTITSVFSGHYPSVLGLPQKRWGLTKTEQSAFKLLTGRLPGSTPSLPRYLAQKGYATGFIGCNAFVLPGNKIAADLGFSHNESHNHSRFYTSSIAARAGDFIDKNAQRPFCLYLHFNNGHGPYRPPEPFKSKFGPSPTDKRPKWAEYYDANIAFADHKIGEILAHLEAKGLNDNTLFILTSDHGIGFEKGHPQGHAKALYQPDLHVPLILSMPKKFPKSERITERRTLLDLYPTILALRGEPYTHSQNIEEPATQILLDGADLFSEPDQERPLYFEGAGIIAMESDNRKAIVKSAPYTHMGDTPSTDKGRLCEIYDLGTDPGETKNRYPEITPDELQVLSVLHDRKKKLAAIRAKQVEQVVMHLGYDAEKLYPQRTSDAFEMQLVAGETDTTYFGVIDTKHWMGSYLGKDFTEGDSIIAGEDGDYIIVEVNVPAGQSKHLGFTPFPPDDPFSISFNANQWPLSGAFVGPYSLAYTGWPLQLGKPRDLRLMTTKVAPEVNLDTDNGIFLWRWNTELGATTQMGGKLEEALRNWGYVK